MLVSCDKEHKKKCEWYLIPDTARYDQRKEERINGKLDEGQIPVCARNFVTNKQDCRLETTIEFAKKAYERKFKLVDLKVKELGNPRLIEEIKFCE